MITLDISFEDLIEYSYNAIEENETPWKHDVCRVVFVFQHDNGNFYRGHYYRSYNEGIEEHYGFGCIKVQKVEKLVEVWEAM